MSGTLGAARATLVCDGKELDAPTNNVLDEARELVEKRLAELDEERQRLERALAELGGKATRRSPGRPARPQSRRHREQQRRQRRRRPPQTPRRRGGTRADQAVKLIEEQPGISASDVAKTMKIKPNYLYRVLGDLEKEGRVKKDGRKYYPRRTAKTLVAQANQGPARATRAVETGPGVLPEHSASRSERFGRTTGPVLQPPKSARAG